jgi:hypothetical protein
VTYKDGNLFVRRSVTYPRSRIHLGALQSLLTSVLLIYNFCPLTTGTFCLLGEYAVCNIAFLSKDVLLSQVSNFATELQDY